MLFVEVQIDRTVCPLKPRPNDCNMLTTQHVAPNNVPIVWPGLYALMDCTNLHSVVDIKILVFVLNEYTMIIFMNKGVIATVPRRVGVIINALYSGSGVLGPVSRKPQKVFGPVKPFLDHLYLKTEKCIRSKLLV